PGVIVSSFWVAIVVAIVLGIINLTIRPLLLLLTLPINIITLGLFTFIINALMFGLAAFVVPGFSVSGFMAALLGSLILTVIKIVTNRLESVR
ncbi:MAG: phage holin family protein, partial [bacterium]|nr:phage holin family protein [bacterium]